MANSKRTPFYFFNLWEIDRYNGDAYTKSMSDTFSITTMATRK